MFYRKGEVSGKPWRPIFNVRTRPPLVQTTAFEFLRQLKSLRFGDVTLPSINSINLPSDRQFIVAFGDLDSLCDCIEFILNHCDVVRAAHRGPDDRGTLWIEFYKKLPKGCIPREQLQFVIWINSIRGPSIAIEDVKAVEQRMPSPIREPSIAIEDVKTVKQLMPSPTRALEASLRGYQPLRLMQRTKRKAPQWLGKMRAAREEKKHIAGEEKKRLAGWAKKRTPWESRRVTLFTVVIVG